MLCDEVMKQNIECVSPRDTAKTAARRMRDANVGFLPVCDDSNKVVGTVTDRDLAIRIVAEDRGAATPIQDVLTREVVACRPEDDLRKAEALMARFQKSRMMCLDDDGRLVGIISLSDIAEHEPANKAQRTLRDVSARETRK